MKREIVTAADAPRPLAHYCQGVLAGDTLYAAGQIASDYKTGVAPEARQDPAFPYYGADIQKQTHYVLKNLEAVYRAAGCELADTVKAQVFLTDLADFHFFDQVWKQFFPAPPPRTTVQIGGLLVPGCKVEIDLTAVRKNVQRRVVSGSGAPTPLAHYCQGVVAGDTLYAAGQIASDYKTGVPAQARQDTAFPYYGSDIQKQAKFVLENIAAVYKAADFSLEDTVKAQVFLTDLDDFYFFDEIWRKFFAAPPPRTTVQVGGLLVPGCKIEIDLTAVHKRVKRTVVKSSEAPSPLAHYCQGILAGETLYAAGQIASDYKTGVPAEARQDEAFPYYGSNIQKQTRYVLKNIEAVYRAAGCSMKDTVKAQVFLADLNDFFYFDQVWKEVFPSPPPRTTVQICGAGLLVPGCKVEIDLTAVKS